MGRLHLWKISLILLSGTLVTGGLISAQLEIYANTPSPSTDGSANSVLGVVGNNVVSALLGSGSNALLWGYVPSDAVIAACKQVVYTGSYKLTATVHHNWGDSPSDLTFQVENTGGCLAASDGSETEIVGTDQSGRRSAIVCPNNVPKVGCPVWITGDDVDAAANSFTTQDAYSRNNFQRRLLVNNPECAVGAAAGATVGSYIMVQALGAVTECLVLLQFLVIDLCVIGLIAVTLVGAVPGAVVGCGIGIGSDNDSNFGCFPGDALAHLQNGELLPMMYLEVGQKVAVWKNSESELSSSSMVIYDEIYAFGHKDASSMGSFYKITVTPLEVGNTESGTEIPVNYLTRTLEISGLHFVPTMKVTDSNKGNEDHQVLHKRAKDMKMGDYVWAVTDGGLTWPHIVTAVSVSFKQGLYNPLTMSGTIVVNMVVASVHSDWFLDSTFDMLGIPSSLPYAYQAVLAPLRMLYRMWPKGLYVFVYEWLDACLDVSKFGTKFYFPTLATAGLVTCLLLAGRYLSTKFRVLH